MIGGLYAQRQIEAASNGMKMGRSARSAEMSNLLQEELEIKELLRKAQQESNLKSKNVAKSADLKRRPLTDEQLAELEIKEQLKKHQDELNERNNA